MNVTKFMYTHPIFRLEEYAKWKKQGQESTALRSSIRYYIVRNKIKRLRRQLFAVIPPNETPDIATFDPYLIAAKVTDDSILAYHTALELHGVAYSSFEQFTFITTQKIKPFEIDFQWYKPVLTPKSLRDSNKKMFGIQKIDRQGMEIKITSVERTYVDVIDRPNLCGGWEEVYRSISNITVLNFDEILEYCILRNNATLNAKVGFFLDLRKGPFEAPLTILKELGKRLPKTPQYMDELNNEKHILINNWNLLVPQNVLNRSWEEPKYDV